MKKCSRCNIEKEFSEFYDRYAMCKKCHNKASLVHQRNKYARDNNHPCLYCGTLFIANSKEKCCSYECRIKFGVKINENGCWIWQGTKFYTGYGKISYEGKYITLHRISFWTFKGEIPEGKFVCHTCDNRSCCNPDHLFLGSNKDNMDDAYKKGRTSILYAKGKKNPMYKDGKYMRIKNVRN